jgi:hypothetical protein
MAVLLASLAAFPVTDAFWRLPCRGRTGVARLDPIVDPGEVSSHVHVVHGGGSKLTATSLSAYNADPI